MRLSVTCITILLLLITAGFGFSGFRWSGDKEYRHEIRQLKHIRDYKGKNLTKNDFYPTFRTSRMAFSVNI